MAFNPTPEVAAARDFGRTFGWDQVVILHLNTVARRLGYASYGETKALCADAKVLAEMKRRREAEADPAHDPAGVVRLAELFKAPEPPARGLGAKHA